MFNAYFIADVDTILSQDTFGTTRRNVPYASEGSGIRPISHTL